MLERDERESGEVEVRPEGEATAEEAAEKGGESAPGPRLFSDRSDLDAWTRLGLTAGEFARIAGLSAHTLYF
jgi:general stress protein YciG